MKRTKLKDRILPTYSKGEEVFNMTTHIVGGGLGVIQLIICIIVAAIHKSIFGIISSIIYGITIIALYTFSSIYHGLPPTFKSKKVFQVIDHCSIFLLIAGSYTPFCLCLFGKYDMRLGLILLGVIWTLATIGIVLNSIDLKKYKVLSMITYLIMGWCIIVKLKLLIQLLGIVGFILLLLGGIIYTIGALFYGIGKKKKWMHSIFHLACVIGTLLQFLCIVIFVI